jgi:hypothetical protein
LNQNANLNNNNPAYFMNGLIPPNIRKDPITGPNKIFGGSGRIYEDKYSANRGGNTNSRVLSPITDNIPHTKQAYYNNHLSGYGKNATPTNLNQDMKNPGYENSPQNPRGFRGGNFHTAQPNYGNSYGA